MKAQTIIEVVDKLIGKVDAVGSTHIDDERLENLKVMEDLVDAMIVHINYASKTKDYKKVKTITNFIDIEYFKPIVQPVLSKNIIIGVGRVTPQKNIHTLIEALSIVKGNGYNFIVKWFGRSDNGEYARLCNELIEKFNVADSILFEGQNKNIRDEYYTASALCLPSLYEGFPNVICEAMGCGLPILCSDVCDNSYIVEDGINGLLFAANDAKCIAKRLEEFLLLSIEQKREMSVNSRKIAECKFSAKEFVDKYVLLIE